MSQQENLNIEDRIEFFKLTNNFVCKFSELFFTRYENNNLKSYNNDTLNDKIILGLINLWLNFIINPKVKDNEKNLLLKILNYFNKK
jgi:hypothetical protein